MLIYSLVSTDDNVYKNLAYETFLTNYASKIFEQDNTPVSILFLWQNDKTIVIGKHQNAFKECNMDFVKDNNIKISRRITGGGAVYHDKENLNFSFISSKDIYSKEENFKIITNALKNIGIDAELSGRNDILVNGKKISGNAFYNNKFCSLHHGTILINSNSEIISKCLTPNKFKLKSKGVTSVKSRVINLIEVLPSITLGQIKEEIQKEFAKKYGDKVLTVLKSNDKEINDLYQKYSSKEWIYKDFVDKGIEISQNFSWGTITINILVKDNIIDNLSITTDALETALFDEITRDLKGQNFEKSVIKNLFEKYNTNIAKDIKSLILSNIK